MLAHAEFAANNDAFTLPVARFSLAVGFLSVASSNVLLGHDCFLRPLDLFRSLSFCRKCMKDYVVSRFKYKKKHLLIYLNIPSIAPMADQYSHLWLY